MPFSGTVSQTVIDVMQLIEHAVRRCGKFAEELTVEQIQSARESLYFLLSHMGNRGIQYWAIQKTVIGTISHKYTYYLPLGSIDVLNAFYRTMNRNTGIAIMSDGDGQLALDGDVSTKCVQAIADGFLGVSLPEPVYVTSVGILAGDSSPFTIVIEYSEDGVTWNLLQAVPKTMWVDGQWLWYDIDPGKSVRYYRIRETVGGFLNVRELFVGSNPSEITLSRLNRDDYTNLPNKTYPSQQPVQYWMDHTINVPNIQVWPVPNNYFTQIVVYCSRYIMDVGDLQGEIEIPQRWYEAIIFSLAHKMSLELPGIDLQRIQYLETQMNVHRGEAEDAEYDRSPIRWLPNVRCYTKI